MNSADGEYKVLLGESFQNVKNAILLGIIILLIGTEDLNKLSLYDKKTNSLNDIDNNNISLDNITKQLRIKSKVFCNS